MGAVLLPVVGLMISLTLCILFYSKKHIHNKETTIYSTMLLLNVIFIIIGLITFLIAKISGNFTYIEIFQKIYMSILVLLNFYSVKYCFSIFKIDFKKTKIIDIALIFITALAIILIFALPLNVIYYDDVLDGEGASYIVAVAYSLISFLIFLVLTFYLLYKKNNIVKVIPFLILILLYLVGFMLRSWHRELIFEGFFYSYILLIMYHTIENPDVKMLNEVTLAKDQAEKSNRAKSEFLSSMSREIRTPLNAIVGFSKLIESSTTLQEAKENSKEIIEASNTLLNMFSNVIDIASVDIDKVSINERLYEVELEFTNLCELFQTKLKEKNLELNMTIDTPKYLIGDIAKIKRIVVNLLDNAIKYTEKGSITINVKSITKNNKCNLEIIIKDTGVGIDKYVIDHLFENFIRSEDYKDSDKSGLGLGLAITKKLVDIMGGTITVSSSKKGSTFKIKLIQKVGEE